MIIKSLIKKIATSFLKIFHKDYLIEYWQIKKSETEILKSISKFYEGFIYKGMKIIDVGANVGNYSRLFVSMGANVIAVEPQAYCQAILKKRFKQDANFILVESAVGEKNTFSIIRKSNSHTVASMNEQWIRNVTESNRFITEKWNILETISVITLDDLIAKNFVPDYIKIDVEGYELNVLKGLSHSVNIISFEITLPELKQTAIDCIEYIAGLGEYQFTIPNRIKLLDVTDWKNKVQIIEEITRLSINNNELVSTDIYAKKINN